MPVKSKMVLIQKLNLPKFNAQLQKYSKLINLPPLLKTNQKPS